MNEFRAQTEIPVFGEVIAGCHYTLRPGSYAIILNAENQVCVLTVDGVHVLPGGGREGAETEEETLLREVLEETGFAVSIEQYIGMTRHFVHAKGEGYFEKICSYYQCEFVNVVSEFSEEDHFVGWYSIDVAMEKLRVKEGSHYWAMQRVVLENPATEQVKRQE